MNHEPVFSLRWGWNEPLTAGLLAGCQAGWLSGWLLAGWLAGLLAGCWLHGNEIRAKEYKQ